MYLSEGIVNTNDTVSFVVSEMYEVIPMDLATELVVKVFSIK